MGAVEDFRNWCAQNEMDEVGLRRLGQAQVGGTRWITGGPFPVASEEGWILCKGCGREIAGLERVGPLIEEWHTTGGIQRTGGRIHVHAGRMHYVGREPASREYLPLPCVRCRALVLYFRDELFEWGKPAGWKERVARLHAWSEAHDDATPAELRQKERVEVEGNVWVAAGPFPPVQESRLLCKLCGHPSDDVSLPLGLAHYRNLPADSRVYLAAYCRACGVLLLYFEDELS